MPVKIAERFNLVVVKMAEGGFTVRDLDQVLRKWKSQLSTTPQPSLFFAEMDS